MDGEIVDHKNGTYEFVYIVPKEGDFSLALRLYDQHIKGSPFKLTVSKASEMEVGGGQPREPSTQPNVHLYLLDDSPAVTLAASRCPLPPPQQPTLQPTPPRPQAPLTVPRDEGSPQARRRKDPKEPAVLWAPLGARPRIQLKTTSSSGLVRRVKTTWSFKVLFHVFLGTLDEALQPSIHFSAFSQELKEGIRESSLTFKEWRPPLLERF